MKNVRMTAILLLIVCLFAMTVSASPSEWASNDVEKAADFGITKKSQQYDYQGLITRESFCEMIYNLLIATENEIEETFVEKFVDTSNKSVLLLNAAGIINGKADNVFAPDDYLTREEAATIIVRMINKKMPMSSTEVWYEYADLDRISSWAMESVQVMSNLGFMKGVGNNNFSPEGNLTTEQAIVILVRVFEKASAEDNETEKVATETKRVNFDKKYGILSYYNINEKMYKSRGFYTELKLYELDEQLYAEFEPTLYIKGSNDLRVEGPFIVLMSMCNGLYDITKTENTFIDGEISIDLRPYNTLGFKIEEKTVYESMTNETTTYTYTRNGRSLSTPESEKNEEEIKAVNFVRDVSGKWYVKVNDFLAYFHIDATVSVETIDGVECLKIK